MGICDIFRRKKWFTVHGYLCVAGYQNEVDKETQVSVSLYARTWESAVKECQKEWHSVSFSEYRWRFHGDSWFEPTKVIDHTEQQTLHLHRSFRFYG